MAFGAVERLQFILTLDANNAIKGFEKVGSTAERELRKAESGLDKAGRNMSKFGALAAAGAAIAGVALVKTASNFSELGVEVSKFADTTGTSLEYASRLIEVIGDLGIETSVAEAGINKMNITASKSPDVFAKFNIEIAKTVSGAVDVERTFSNVVDGLNAIEDPARRAEAAQAILGKGWKGMSELIAGGSAKLAESMAQVADAKVFDSDEAQKAKDYRASMDTLTDSFEELALAIGEGAAPVIGAFAKTLGGVVDVVGKADEVTGGLVGTVLTIGTAAIGAAGAISAIGGKAIKMRDSFSQVNDAGVRQATTLGKVAGALGVVGAVVGIATYAYGVYADRKEAAVQRTKDLRGALLGEAGAQNEALAALANNSDEVKRFLETQQTLNISTKQLTEFVKDGTGPVAALSAKWSEAKRVADGTYPTLQALAESVGIDVSESGWDLQAAAVRDFIEQSRDLKSSNDEIVATQALVNAIGADGTDVTKAATEATEEGTSANRRAYLAQLQISESGKAAAERTKELADANQEIIDQKIADDLEAHQEALADLNDEVDSATDKFDDLASAAGSLKSAIDKVFGSSLSMEQANRALAEGAAKLKTAFDENGATLDINTEKGRANREEIESQVAAILDYGVAAVGAGKSNEEAAASIDLLTLQLRDQLTQYGLNDAQIDEYLTTLGLTPENVSTVVSVVGDAEAKERLKPLLAAMLTLSAGAQAKIKTLIDQGDFDKAERMLKLLQAIESSAKGGKRGNLRNMEMDARGTTNAGDVFIAGEEGPELIVGMRGAHVYTAAQTRAMSFAGGTGEPSSFEQTAAIWEAQQRAIAAAAGQSTGGGSTPSSEDNEIEIARRQYERGKLSLDQFRAILVAKKAGLVEYSDAENDLYNQIKQLDDQQARDEQERAERKRQADEEAAAHAQELADNEHRYLFDIGQLSLADYQAYLAAKLAGTEQYSNDWISLQNAMSTLQANADKALADSRKAEQQAETDRIASIIAKARAAADLITAIGNEAAANQAELAANNELWLIAASTETTPEQKADAADKAAKARAAHVAALIAGADARANAAGFADDSPEWNASVRQSIADYEAGNHAYDAELNAYLATLPKFHSGGVVPGSYGQEVPIMARAGEVVSNGAGHTFIAVTINANGLDVEQADALVRRRMSELAAQIKAGQRR